MIPRISDLIKELESIAKNHGNLEVLITRHLPETEQTVEDTCFLEGFEVFEKEESFVAGYFGIEGEKVVEGFFN